MHMLLMPFECRGRDRGKSRVLSTPIAVILEIAKRGDTDFVIRPTNCPYNVGVRAFRCGASHPGTRYDESVEILCPYAVDLPGTLDARARF